MASQAPVAPAGLTCALESVLYVHCPSLPTTHPHLFIHCLWGSPLLPNIQHSIDWGEAQPHSRSAVLNLWVVVPLGGVTYQIHDISDIYIMIPNSSEIAIKK